MRRPPRAARAPAREAGTVARGPPPAVPTGAQPEPGPRLPSHRLADPPRVDRRTPLLARTGRTVLRRLAAAGECPQDLEDGGDVRLHAGAHVEGAAFAAAERRGVGLGDVLD